MLSTHRLVRTNGSDGRNFGSGLAIETNTAAPIAGIAHSTWTNRHQLQRILQPQAVNPHHAVCPVPSGVEWQPPGRQHHNNASTPPQQCPEAAGSDFLFSLPKDFDPLHYKLTTQPKHFARATLPVDVVEHRPLGDPLMHDKNTAKPSCLRRRDRLTNKRIPHPFSHPHRTPTFPVTCSEAKQASYAWHSLPKTMDEATPMKPKKAAEEGHVSKLRSLMVAICGLWGLGLDSWKTRREAEKRRG